MSVKELLKLLEELIAIPSQSREEAAAADCLEAWMTSHGLAPRRKGNNLWCCCDPDTSKPALLLNAHIDTVRVAAGWRHDPYKPMYSNCSGENPFAPAENSEGVSGNGTFSKATRLYGLGSNDDGGALVALLGAYMQLKDTKQPYRLVFSATAEEEISGVGGIETLFPEIGPIALGIIGEPTQMRMAVAERGLMVLDCTVYGKSGHAARNEGDNAIYKALPDIEWFRNYSFPKVSGFLGPVKMTVTQINAGYQHNVVPGKCTFVVDVRSNGMYRNPDLLAQIKEAVNCEVKERSIRLGGSSIPMEHPVVKRGLELGLEAFGSPTTSNCSLCPGFPTLKIGPGDSARSHTADEYICPSEIEEGMEIYVKLLKDLQL